MKIDTIQDKFGAYFFKAVLNCACNQAKKGYHSNGLKDETYTGFEKFVMLWKYMMFYDTSEKKNLLEENYTDITKPMQKEK